jgi:hypothetical protein
LLWACFASGWLNLEVLRTCEVNRLVVGGRGQVSCGREMAGRLWVGGGQVGLWAGMDRFVIGGKGQVRLWAGGGQVGLCAGMDRFVVGGEAGGREAALLGEYSSDNTRVRLY